MEYVLIRSWHVIRTYTRVPGGVLTLCGRSATTSSSITASTDGQPIAVVADILPGGRSCESCLRIVARRADTA